MVTFQYHCVPTILCKMKRTASCTPFWRSMVSHLQRASHIQLPICALTWGQKTTFCCSCSDEYRHKFHFIIYTICASIFPLNCVVRNPPVVPSKYIRVPRKRPDKMGFDEVSIEWCEDGFCKNGPLSTLCAERMPGLLGVCNSAGSIVSRLQVFMINLKRRTDRRKRMLRALYEQSISCKVIAAVDGK